MLEYPYGEVTLIKAEAQARRNSVAAAITEWSKVLQNYGCCWGRSRLALLFWGNYTS